MNNCDISSICSVDWKVFVDGLWIDLATPFSDAAFFRLSIAHRIISARDVINSSKGARHRRAKSMKVGRCQSENSQRSAILELGEFAPVFGFVDQVRDVELSRFDPKLARIV